MSLQFESIEDMHQFVFNQATLTLINDGEFYKQICAAVERKNTTEFLQARIAALS